MSELCAASEQLKVHPSPPSQNLIKFPSLFRSSSRHSSHNDIPPSIYPIDVDEESDAMSFPRANKVTSRHTPARSSSSELIARSTQQTRNRRTRRLSTTSNGSGREVECTLEMPSDEYSYNAIIEEAKNHYRDTKPPFCVSHQELTTKTVKLSVGEEQCDIVFKSWSENLGYWTLIDKDDDRHIVKHRGGKYYVWTGVNKGLSRDPIAFALTLNDKLAIGTQASSNKLTETTDLAQTKSLRPRKAVQSMPYTMYNTQKKYESRGIRLSETQLEEAIITARRSSTAAPDRSLSPVKKRKLRRSSSTDSMEDIRLHLDQPETLSPPFVSTNTTSSRDTLLQNTVLRTRFHEFEDATIPLAATNYADHTSFFQCIKKKWELKLKGRQIQYCIAMFPWLGPDKNILLQELELDGLETVLDEVERAPEPKHLCRIEVVITVYAKEEVEGRMA